MKLQKELLDMNLVEQMDLGLIQYFVLKVEIEPLLSFRQRRKMPSVIGEKR